MRSPRRVHDRETFFKYMSASTAKLVLSNRTLRWSSPLLFNDPFDVPRELSFGLTAKDVWDALARKIANLINFPPQDTSHLELKLRNVVDVARSGMPPEAKESVLEALRKGAETSKPSQEGMDALRAKWR